ncbi:MAG: hypothetical protein K6F64_07910 [Clostridia bacterium]|nr:hypothetical protein [Clostridia bacterium]
MKKAVSVLLTFVLLLGTVAVGGMSVSAVSNVVLTLTPSEPKEDYTVQAKLVDAQGNVLSETDEANIDINTGFFARLYRFFCSLIQRIIDVFKGTAA